MALGLSSWSNVRLLSARWLPACMLIAVALGQAWRVFTADQVVGKGGGFGMFAVAEGRAERLWSADCLTPDRVPCRIFLPRGAGPLNRFGPGMDTHPRQALHQAVANRLIRSTYVRVQPSELAEAGAIPAHLLELLPAETLETPLYRPARVNENGVSLPAIRLRYWRMLFDGEAVAQRVEPMPYTEERGAW